MLGLSLRSSAVERLPCKQKVAGPAPVGGLFGDMKIKGIIFDFDNTLINSSKTIDDANKSVLNKMQEDFEMMDLKTFDRILKKVQRKFDSLDPMKRYKRLFYELFAEESGLSIDTEKIDVYAEIFESHLINRMEFTEGAEETIDRLKNMGLKVGLLTGAGFYPGLKKRTLEKFDRNGKFDVKIIAGDNIQESKHNPEAFKKTAAMLKLKTDEIIFIGDTPDIDIDNAKEAGMKTVLFDRYNEEKRKISKNKPDFVIEDMRDIYKILDGLNQVLD